MSESTDILRILQRHVGSENAISACDICIEAGMNERNVRRIISSLITDHSSLNVIICAKLSGRGGEGGYFIARTYEEIVAYWSWLDDLRAKAEAKVVAFENLCRKNGIR